MHDVLPSLCELLAAFDTGTPDESRPLTVPAEPLGDYRPAGDAPSSGLWDVTIESWSAGRAFGRVLGGPGGGR